MVITAIVLDESESMTENREIAIKSFNRLLKNQQLVVPDTDDKFYLTIFNHKIRLVADGKQLSDVKRLKTSDYAPDGSTKLYDAIGRTMNRIEKHEKDNNILFIIITDGEDTSSKYFSKQQIFTMIKEKQKTPNWHFKYCGINSKSWRENANICDTVEWNDKKIDAAISQISTQMSTFRSSH
ncbi:putative von Willebrand factor type A domain protein-like protein [Leptotrombidium deliense]|uniref:Putative von Willebrand factor type A domain protein-like protein n=1 Tax=Leptotrombidium deliense TaxID=299467 RepID=A0A443RW89_9ACAR|nr:putative von Willebrand factor type A domain protein-like protein [Leptotrombidium deliense]